MLLVLFARSLTKFVKNIYMILILKCYKKWNGVHQKAISAIPQNTLTYFLRYPLAHKQPEAYVFEVLATPSHLLRR